jgi:hypothetical protein
MGCQVPERLRQPADRRDALLWRLTRWQAGAPGRTPTGRSQDMPTSRDLVTIGCFGSEPRAELVRGHLVAHGIVAVLQNAMLSTAQSFGVGFGNVLLQVSPADAAAATRLVAEWDSAGSGGAASGERCLACGAPLLATDTRCAACGWTWEERRPS